MLMSPGPALCLAVALNKLYCSRDRPLINFGPCEASVAICYVYSCATPFLKFTSNYCTSLSTHKSRNTAANVNEARPYGINLCVFMYVPALVM